MNSPTIEDRQQRIADALTLARNMRNNGASRESIEYRLARRGLDGAAIKEVLDQLPLEEPDNIILRGDPTSGFRSALVFVGLVIAGLGAFMEMVGRMGEPPILPFAGFAIGILGAVVARIGRS